MEGPVEGSQGPKRASVARRFLPLVGLALLAWVLSRLDGTALREAVSQIAPSALLIASLPFTANMLIKGVRWWRLLAAQGRPLPFGVALAAYVGAQFYGQGTVGRLGEFYRMEALLERGVSPGQSLASCLVDRLFDLLVVLVVGSVMSAFLVGHMQAARAATIVVGVFAGLCALGYAAFRKLGAARIRARLSELATRVEGRPWLARLVTLLRDVLFGTLLMLRPGPIMEALAWTTIAWVGYFGTLWLLAGSLGVGASVATLAGAAALAALSALLPLTFSGLGARELIYQEVLASAGVGAELAVVTALLHLAVMSASAIGGGAIALLIRQRQRATTS